MNHQDWNPVVLRGGTGRASSGQVNSDSRAARAQTAARRGSASERSARMAKLANDTESLSHRTVSGAVRDAIVRARVAKGMTRARLAMAVNVQERVVAEYETGKAIPDNALLGRLERALGAKLRGN
eukprot:jgi/Tetstr1/464113/TSEL_008918.t1